MQLIPITVVEPLLGIGGSTNTRDRSHITVLQGMGIDGEDTTVFAEPHRVQQWFTGIDLEQVTAVTTTYEADRHGIGHPTGGYYGPIKSIR
jgi:hypothetical protein